MKNSTVFENVAKFCRECGIAVTPTRGAAPSEEGMATIMTDGVPYCIDPADVYGKLTVENMEHAIKHYRLTVERHHAKVKAVYEYCASLGLGDVWALCGGGGQLQMFFGTRAGYLGTLYLDLEDLSEQEGMEDYLAAVGNKLFTLELDDAQYVPYFMNFSHPEVNVTFDYEPLR